MRALTIFPVYAELIAVGLKRIENRSRPISYRGPVLIHASLKTKHAGESLDTLARRYGVDPSTMLPGHALTVVDLVDCLPLDSARTHHPDQSSLITGPWCWILANPRRLITPIRLTGQLGLWRPPVSSFSVHPFTKRAV
jgi:hypothetical protein